MQKFGGQQYLMENGAIILNYAKQSGVLTKEQAYMMLPQKHYQTIDKVLNGLRVERTLFLRGDRYYVINPMKQQLSMEDYQMIKCLWVLLDLKGDAVLKDSNSNFWLTSAEKPAILSYVKSNVLYKIVPVDRGEEIKLKALETAYKNELEQYPESKIKYIIVVPNIETLEYMPEVDIPHIFAIVTDIPDEEIDYETKKLIEINYYEG